MGEDLSHKLENHNGLHVVVVGAGLGGLACALACRRGNPSIKVTILERSPEILPVGAGIQLPPNATRIMSHFGLLEKLKRVGGITMQRHTLRRYSDGRIIVEKPLGERVKSLYGAEWLVIHRAEYQNLLLGEAIHAGACLIKDAEVVNVYSNIDGSDGNCAVLLKDGRKIQGDVVVGADGLWSRLREYILDRLSPPSETGDIAYRGTFSREQLTSFHDARITELIEASNIQVWMGPGKHVVFYPVRNKTEYNLVLICPDNLPNGIRTQQGTLAEMIEEFNGWDPALTKMISCLKTALKWKLCHHRELDRWTKGTVALLGDASHPTLPYQAQGAAMAVEDGAIIGLLLSKLLSSGLALDQKARYEQLSSLLKLYESLRKERTEINVRGAIQSQEFYHLPDGEIQIERDQLISELPKSDWQRSCKWNWGDEEYQASLLGFDVLADAEQSFNKWAQNKTSRIQETVLDH
ncbi:putative salicylate hydroxylase [Xylogone sp. PMI_703]|nr:putative salicylate hydroxylase [Xylogone sp. PMI_703]